MGNSFKSRLCVVIDWGVKVRICTKTTAAAGPTKEYRSPPSRDSQQLEKRRRKNINDCAKGRASQNKMQKQKKRHPQNVRLRLHLLVDSAVSLGFCETHRHSHHQCRKT